MITVNVGKAFYFSIYKIIQSVHNMLCFFSPHNCQEKKKLNVTNNLITKSHNLPPTCQKFKFTRNQQNMKEKKKSPQDPFKLKTIKKEKKLKDNTITTINVPPHHFFILEQQQ